MVYINEGPTRNQCHVIATDILDRKTDMDPKVFYNKV